MEGTSEVKIENFENILATLPNCGNPLKLEMETKACKKCKTTYPLHTFGSNSNGQIKKYCPNCLQKAKEKYERNKEQVLEYHQNNKARRNEWKRNKGKIDPVFRAKESMKIRIHDLLKNVKAHKTNRLMGCSKHELQEWLSSQFGEEYSWETYGKKWHIDHVVPINFFDIKNADEQLLCFNWTNLRPLSASENGSKSCKVLVDDIMNHIQTIKKFPRYQADYENSWWRRLELRYGNNPQDAEDFESLLKWAIRNQDSTEDGIRLND